MELNNYLRPGYAKRQQRIYLDRLNEELFDIYQTILGNQLYDQHCDACLSLPVDPEGLNGDYSPMDDRLYQVFEHADGTAVAEKLIGMMRKAGWKMSYYFENGLMMINLEENED